MCHSTNRNHFNTMTGQVTHFVVALTNTPLDHSNHPMAVSVLHANPLTSMVVANSMVGRMVVGMVAVIMVAVIMVAVVMFIGEMRKGVATVVIMTCP